MKFKSLLLIAFLSITIPFAMAESAEQLLLQGVHADKQGNYIQAANLYEKSCNMGNAIGCHNLGFLYAQGMGVRQNFTKAIQLYENSCNDGYVISCSNLGHLYENGQGVTRLFSSH